MKLVKTQRRIRSSMTIIYKSKSGEISKRTILILKIKDEQIIAYCYLRNEIRSFHIQNILAAEINKRKGER